jgi:DNA-binding XRE family transcriptional regulator
VGEDREEAGQIRTRIIRTQLDCVRQTIERDGEPEYAVVPIEEYRSRVAALEEAADVAAIERAWGDDAAGETVPGEVVNAILDGASALRAWRLNRGLTLEVLMERIGVSKGYLSQIEQGRKPGTLGVFRRLADALGVYIDDLAGWENDAAEEPADNERTPDALRGGHSANAKPK